jgi:hypothetical protein
MIVTFRYGTGNEKVHTLPEGTTLGNALNDQRLKAGLGYGSNVEGSIGGIPQPPTTTLREGMLVTIADKACQKAVQAS